MRKNHNRHDRKTYELYDIVYTPLPEIAGIRMMTVHPLKTIYVNTAAPLDAYHTCEFHDFDPLLDFIARHGITLP